MMQVEQNLLLAFIKNVRHFGLDSIVIWGQLLLVSLSLALGYMSGRYAKLWVSKKKYPTRKKVAQAQAWARLVFPLSALAIISLFKAMLHLKYQPLYFLDLVSALLLALAALRVIVRMLQVTFSAKQWAKQSERAVVWTVWLLFALYVTGFSTPIIIALQTISFQYGKTVISAWDILQTVSVVAGTLLFSLMLSQMIEVRLLRATTGDASLRVVVARLIKASFVVLAFMIALPLVGIDLTVLSVFGGALGVGLGFGLQKIASNYVSGFILLLDRSLRIGDMVEIGTEQGQVQGLTARYIILKSLDGTVALIPNDTLISSVVVNKSYIDRNIRVTLPVQVAYSSDIKLAMQLMLNAIQGIERILIEPAPNVTLKVFSDSGIDLELGFWIADQEQGTSLLRSEINMRIWESFNANNINFPYPHRDISLVNVPDSIEKWLKPSEKPVAD